MSEKYSQMYESPKELTTVDTLGSDEDEENAKTFGINNDDKIQEYVAGGWMASTPIPENPTERQIIFMTLVSSHLSHVTDFKDDVGLPPLSVEQRLKRIYWLYRWISPSEEWLKYCAKLVPKETTIKDQLSF